MPEEASRYTTSIMADDAISIMVSENAILDTSSIGFSLARLLLYIVTFLSHTYDIIAHTGSFGLGQGSHYRAFHGGHDLYQVSLSSP